MTRQNRLPDVITTGLACAAFVLASAGFGDRAAAQNSPPAANAPKAMQPKTPDYSPYPDQQFPNRVLWGVAHVHTGYSFDSGMFGVTLTPDDLFRVSTGGEVVLDNGQRFKQDRPLDWVSITDHAEYLGISDQIRAGSPELLANPQGKRWYEMSQKSPEEGVKAAIEAVVSMQTGKPVFRREQARGRGLGARHRGRREVEPAGRLHHAARLRVDFRARRQQPASHRHLPRRRGAREPGRCRSPPSTARIRRELWKYMDAYAKKTGGQVLAIPHNGNLSNGMMYSAETFDGKPMDRAYAEARASHEPLLEATQIKGDGETHPYLSPNDEFADFERWDVDFGKMAPAQNSVLHANYVRSALKLGLELDAKLGANPYQSGMIGGNDAHVGVVTTREDNFFGEFANGLPSPERWKTPLVDGDKDPSKGRWCRSGTNRPRAWAACGRARTPARRSGTRSSARKSTPPRATGRSCACSPAGTSRRRTSNRPDFAANGYAHGVPMGGNLSQGAGRQAARLPGLRDARSGRPQPRPHPGHQGLARQGRQDAGAHLRRGRLRRAQDRPGRPLQDPGRQHRGRGERDLHQHHRRRRRCRRTGRTRRSTPRSARSTTCA